MADRHSEGYQEALRRIEVNYRTKAEDLDLKGLELTELPPEIGKLKHLAALNIGYDYGTDKGNNLKSLPKEITQLANLQELYLTNNQLSELPKEIAQLTKLQALYLDNNQLSELPKEIAQLTNLQELYLDNNQLNIPPEIIRQWNRPQVILNYYFENVVGKDRPLAEIKMLLLGEGEVGKTALVHRLVDDEFMTTGKTEGIDIHKWNVEIKKNCQIQINIWDFAGQEITHATHQFFLTKRSLYLLVLASRGDEKANRLEEWLKIIQNLGGASPVIIVCNKSDEHQMNLDERALREKYPNIREIVKVSCKKGTNVKSLKQKILKEISQMPHVFDPFSKKWFAVKQRLENLKENYIPFDDYVKICDEEEVSEELDRETLIKFLHDLGVVLNFLDDPMVNETSVLKPEWITGGVYKILTSKLLDDKHGVLTLEMVREILDNRRYPKQKHRFIVQMMEKFERCFPLDKNKFLVPDLLPKQQPDFGDWKPEKIGLGFQYHYEIEPGSFITRFIVNMNKWIDGETYWRKGVVLKNADGDRALVKADLEDKKIFIRIDGRIETQRGFLSMIRRQFEKIHETMSNLKVTEYVQHEKGLIAFEDLTTLEDERIEEHFFPHLKTKINVSELLNGIETKHERYGRLAEKMRPGIKSEEDFRNVFSKGIGSKAYSMGSFEMKESENEYYDVALSFAGEDREFVKEVYEELVNRSISTFYDFDEDITLDLWGKELIEELDEIYRKRSKCVVMFVSEDYAKKVWTKLERRSSLAKALNEKREYVLPARFDDTELPGLLPTVAFVDLRKETPQSFAQKIIRKLGKLQNK
jgi:internalin A